MAVSVNTVYQTVLYILNKEQRGYIAPTEFNYYAEQAQREIFEAYFYDDAHFSLNRKGMAATGTSDIKKNIQEKIDLFSRTASTVATTASGYSAATDVSYANGIFTLPTNLYRLGAVYYNDGTTTRHVTMIPHEGLHYVLNSRLTEPSRTFPKFTRSDDSITVYPNSGTNNITTNISVHYVKEPDTPHWGSITLGSARVPTYDPRTTGGTTVHFELHNSEQYRLIEKILFYAGIQLKQQDLIHIASQEEAQDNQNKKT